MEAKHSAETLRHLEKQKECLTDAYRTMSHDLHRLQMLMRKLYEVMSAEGLLGKGKSKMQLSRDYTNSSLESAKES